MRRSRAARFAPSCRLLLSWLLLSATNLACSNAKPSRGGAASSGDNAGDTASASSAGSTSTATQGGTTDGSAGSSLASAGATTDAGGSGGTAAEQTWTLPPGAELASCVPASWTVKASSSAQGNPPEYALDDVDSTRWSSGAEQNAGTFYEIDFGGWVTIDQLVIDNSAGSRDDYPRGYEVRASKDGVDFARIPSFGWLDFPPTDGMLTIDFEPVPLKALQIATTEHALSWWSIHELKLRCQGADDGVPPVDPLACTPQRGGSGVGGAAAETDAADGGSGAAIDPFDRANWTATASSTAPGDTTHGAIDGSIATRWSSGSAQVGGEWFQLDLGAVGCISSVFLVSGGGDAAIGFSVEVSADGVTYEQVAQGAGNPVDHIQFKPHLARYVRVNQRGAGGANWWSIQELEVA